MASNDAESKLFKALANPTKLFSIATFTKQDLYIIIGHLNKKGTIETLEAIN